MDTEWLSFCIETSLATWSLCCAKFCWEAVLVIILSGITIFRKQLSSNRVYADRLSPFCELQNSITTKSVQIRRRVESLSSLAKNCQRIPPNVEVLKGVNLTASNNSELMFSNEISRIASFMSPDEVGKFSMTDKNQYNRLQQPWIWKEQCQIQFGHIFSSQIFQDSLQKLHCHWNEEAEPIQGWKRFLLQLDCWWTDIACAGHNTERSCLVGIDSSVFELTQFLDEHPGSPETILVNAGSNCTRFFEEVGHSVTAKAMMPAFECLSAKAGGIFSQRHRQKICDEMKAELKREHKELFHGPQIVYSLPLCNHCEKRGTGHLTEFHTPCMDMHLARAQVFFVPMTNRWAFWWPCCSQFGWIQKKNRNL
uniref:Cytochrome b5 heme-binding domain-containing protein n=1 Tax=Fibrocapsa japonica TaxID=94617 RepID=A0A7S2XZA4_9STRA|mmetsp:Transcript_3073/g.4532  ORF Transcript_3073/g.4532 Transcript_3073/m.4532 type:complete len:367 (+) Transcript_3073:66-1166(+)